MSKMKKIAILAIVAMVLTMLPVQMFAATTDSTRLSGAGRVETALDICSAGWTTATTVVVAPADQANLVDALAVAPLAGQESAPILLTFKDALDPAVKAKISALGAKKVYVVGAISDSVKNEIAALSGVTAEVLKGASRWDTTKAINAKLNAPAGTFVVGYNAIPDALSVASFAAKNKYAIILADVNGAIPAGQAAVGSKTYAIGGTSLVADIAGATRIAGADRFATNTQVAQTLSFDYSRVYVANGLSCVDALSVAPLAAKYGSFVALASASDVAAASYLNGKVNAASKIIAVGGTSAISDSVAALVKAAAPLSLSVESVTPVSLNAFTVKFNQAVDYETAERTTNYKVNGSQLGTYSAAVLLDDDQTVLVTIGNGEGGFSDNASFKQNTSATIDVLASSIYTKDKKTSVAGTSKVITLGDTTIPALSSVKAVGNSTLRVIFSEPVAIPSIGDVGAWKIDGTNLSSLGLTAITSGDGYVLPGDVASSGYVTDGSALGGLTPWRGTNELDLQFATALAAGNHTMTVARGDVNSTGTGKLQDRAGFVVPQSDSSFTVESSTTAPTVQSVTCENNNIYVTYDKPMLLYSPGGLNSNPNAADNINLYQVNDKGWGAASVSTAVIKANTDHKVLKLTAASNVIQVGTNVITIKKDMKDSFGNKITTGSDDLRFSFTYTSDTTKPTVTSVVPLTATKVRITFSEPVDPAFAQNAVNYELRNSDGAILQNGIDQTYSFTTVPANTPSDTVELTFSAGALRGTGYTLKIKNIADMATNANIMDMYTATFDGIDDLGPNLVSANNDQGGNASKAFLLFSKPIDASTVIFDNFGYTDNTNPSFVQRALPTGATVSLDGSGKIVTIVFPDAYKVIPNQGANSRATGGGGTYSYGIVTNYLYPQDKYGVTGLRASNIKDKAGNVLQGVAQVQSTILLSSDVADANKASFVADSLNLYDNGPDVRAEFLMTQEITSLTPSDFILSLAGGLSPVGAPSSGYTQGRKVVLNYTGNASAVRALGIDAYLTISGAPTSKNVGGVLISTLTPGTTNRVFDDQIKPTLKSIALTTAPDGGVTYTELVITFSEDIDSTISGLYNDDFVITYNGSAMPPITPVVSGKTLTYRLGENGAKASGKYSTTPGDYLIKSVTSKTDIRDKKDNGAKNFNTFAPSSDNINGMSGSFVGP